MKEDLRSLTNKAKYVYRYGRPQNKAQNFATLLSDGKDESRQSKKGKHAVSFGLSPI